MRVYHFLNKKHGLENIRNRRLKISTFDNLNDPFELLSLSLIDVNLREAILKLKNSMATQRGIICFSKCWQNPVQWSHYADRHIGLCLGFDVPDEFLFNINYTSRRLSVGTNILSGEEAECAMRSILSTKYAGWRYEKEVRLFTDLTEREDTRLYFKSFDDDLALKELFVGANSDITRLELDEALGDIKASIKKRKVRASFQRFRMVEQRKKELWE